MPGPTVPELLALQCGVVARFQALEAGLSDHDIRRLVRRREWARVHPGVYVDHTGPLTWTQRAWAGVLVLWPSALSHASAVRDVAGAGRTDQRTDDRIHVAVDRQRSCLPPPGVVVHRVGQYDAKALAHTHPPRVRLEHAALDVAAEAPNDLVAISTLADLVQARLTTADRLLGALAARTRIARRPLLTAALNDVAEGTCSLLEHDYLALVERPHGLPRPERQVRDSGRGPVFRDVVYRAFGVVVELDGRLFHDNARARDLDLDRDLDAAVSGLLTVRLGWGQAHVRPSHRRASGPASPSARVDRLDSRLPCLRDRTAVDRSRSVTVIDRRPADSACAQAGAPTVGMPRPTAPGPGRGRAGLPGVAGAGTAMGQDRPVGDQVVRGGVGDLDLDHVARADLDGRRRPARAGVKCTSRLSRARPDSRWVAASLRPSPSATSSSTRAADERLVLRPGDLVDHARRAARSAPARPPSAPGRAWSRPGCRGAWSTGR